MILSRLVYAGKMQRFARGVYGLSDCPVDGHHSLAEVSLRVPRGLVCLFSIQFKHIKQVSNANSNN